MSRALVPSTSTTTILQSVPPKKSRTSLTDVIHAFLTDEEFVIPGDCKKCTGMAIVHMSGGPASTSGPAQGKEVHKTTFGNKDWTPEALSDLYLAKAETYAQDLAGAQTFNLLAFYTGQSEPQRHHPFVVNGQLEAQFDKYGSLTTEGPDARGQTQQAMRLTEVIVQRTFGQQSMIFDHTRYLIDRLDKESLTLKEENRELWAVLLDTMKKDVELSHTKRMQEMEYSRNTAERKQWMKFVPPLVNTITGREIFPQGTADTALVESIADALDEDTILKVSTLLPPTLWGPLAARFEGAIKDKQAKRLQTEETRKQLGAGHKDPAADAAGEVEK